MWAQRPQQSPMARYWSMSPTTASCRLAQVLRPSTDGSNRCGADLTALRQLQAGLRHSLVNNVCRRPQLAVSGPSRQRVTVVDPSRPFCSRPSEAVPKGRRRQVINDHRRRRPYVIDPEQQVDHPYKGMYRRKTLFRKAHNTDIQRNPETLSICASCLWLLVYRLQKDPSI